MAAPPANFGHLELLALTGRTRAHVQDCADPPCTLHPAALEALLALRAAAARAGLDLTPVSSFRSFEQQLGIWNAKYHGQRPLLDRDAQPLVAAELDEASRVAAILTWSALPGASRHHWGTEIDVIDRAALAEGERTHLMPADYAADGRFAALGAWLQEHAADHGFYWPYDRDRGGVQPEPWHLSFAPLAAPALADLTIDVLANALAAAPGLAGRATICTRLPELYERHVRAVAPPPLRALAAPALNRASRPS
jgi:LAS superfamily LD-carboxypeptidase LdcB